MSARGKKHEHIFLFDSRQIPKMYPQIHLPLQLRPVSMSNLQPVATCITYTAIKTSCNVKPATGCDLCYRYCNCNQFQCQFNTRASGKYINVEDCKCKAQIYADILIMLNTQHSNEGIAAQEIMNNI